MLKLTRMVLHKKDDFIIYKLHVISLQMQLVDEFCSWQHEVSPHFKPTKNQ